MTKIRLLRPHIVNGTTYPVGKVLDLPADVVQFLIEAKVAESLTPPEPKPIVPRIKPTIKPTE